MLKAKLKAALIHALVSILVGLLTAVVVFCVWYPEPFAKMTHGTDLFFLVLAVEITMGPLMSLVIFNPSKPKSELVRDYGIIGFLQLSALIYGLYSVSLSRPVYVVFVKDRLEVVAATELQEGDAVQAAEQYQSMPWLGPRNICVEMPTDPQKKSDLLMSALEGRDVQLQPQYYRECREGEIAGKAYTRDQFFTLTSLSSDQIPQTLRGESFTWLPVVTRFGSWVVFFPNGKVSEPVYVDADPFAIGKKGSAGVITPPASTNPPPDNP